MRRVRTFARRVLTSVGLHRFEKLDMQDHDLRAEFDSHVNMQTAENIRRGMPPDDARRQALLAAGSLTGAAELTREKYRFVALEQFIADVRYAFRGLKARPLFAAVVVLTLGLGVGVNVVMFGVLDRTLLRPPAYIKDPSTAHRIYLESTGSNGQRRISARTEYRRYVDIATTNQSLSDIAAFTYRRAAIGDGEFAREMDIGVVSANFFGFFHAPPLLGRYFTTSEDKPPVGEAVVVLSYGFWRTQYGGELNVLGKTVRIGSILYTIIGVAPRGFSGLSDGVHPAAFIPVTTYGASMRPRYYNTYSWTYVSMLGRRKADVSVATMNADLSRAHQLSWNVERRLPVDSPFDKVARPSAVGAPLQFDRGPLAPQESKVAIWASGVAIIVLLVACANVANLLLSRSVRRQREMAIRRAIGGTPARLMQQVLTESLVFAIVGSLAGLVGALVTAGTLQRLLAANTETWQVVTDGRTIVFTAALAAVTALLAGMLPALQMGKGDLAGSLKAGFRESAYQRSRTGTALLLVQTTLTVVLLVGAGLFMQSLQRVRDVRLGYDPDRLVYVNAVLRGTTLGSPQSQELTERLLAAARTVPGVTSGTSAVSVPFRGGRVEDLFVSGVDSIQKLGRFELQAGTPEYFTTMGTRILRGRAPTADDRIGTPLVAVVSEAMGQALWRGDDPIGKCMRIGEDTAPCTTVIGIAEDIKTRGFAAEGEFHYYLPTTQFAASNAELFLRVYEPAATLGALRMRLQREMPGNSYVTVTPLQEILDPAMRSWTSGATIFMVFGSIALVLAVIGLYGVIAFSVAHRTQEIGVRIALGAETRSVLALVVGEGVRIALVGVGTGVAVALAASNSMRELLFSVSPHDPVVYAVVAATVLIASIAACTIPAVRAAQVDPNVALRGD